MWIGVGNRFARPLAGGGLGNRAPSLDVSFLSSTLDPRFTFTRASTATDGLFTDAAGSGFNSFSSGAPRITPTNGLLLEQSTNNFLLNSGAPVTQTTGSLSTSTYCLWVIGTGSAAITAGTATITGAGTATAGTFVVFNVTVAGTVTVTVTGSLTRFQLEQTAVPTSYVPTTGVTASRAAESCTVATGAWFNAAASTIMAEARLVNSTSQSPVVLCMDDGTVTNRFFINCGTALHANMQVTNAGSSTNNTTANSMAIGNVFKMAGSISSVGIGAALLGVATTARTALPAGGVPVVNTLRVGFIANPASQPFDGFIRRVSYYPRDLWPSDLARITV